MAVAPKYGEFADGKLWFHRKGTIVTLGVTSSAIDELGTIESIEFPDEGSDFVKGEAVITLEGSLGSLEVTSPAAGVVEEINEAAKSEPTMVTEDPLEEGWLVKLEIEDKTELKEYAADADE